MHPVHGFEYTTSTFYCFLDFIISYFPKQKEVDSFPALMLTAIFCPQVTFVNRQFALLSMASLHIYHTVFYISTTKETREQALYSGPDRFSQPCYYRVCDINITG